MAKGNKRKCKCIKCSYVWKVRRGVYECVNTILGYNFSKLIPNYYKRKIRPKWCGIK